MALRTIKPEQRSFPQISIHVPQYLACVRVDADIETTIGETNLGQWFDLDRLLVQLRESHSIRSKVIRTVLRGEKQDMKDCIGCLLPEMTKRGMVDLVE